MTGRMGTNQHLVRSILAIREQGGVELVDEGDDRVLGVAIEVVAVAVNGFLGVSDFYCVWG